MVRQFGVRCNGCNKFCYGEVINFHGKYYHLHCFACDVSECTKDLTIVGCFSVDGRLYCRDDYHKRKGVKCAGCLKFVEGDAISAVGCTFHPYCFACVTCGDLFPEGVNISYDGEDLFCLSCKLKPKKVNGIHDKNAESNDLTLSNSKPTSQPVNGNHNFIRPINFTGNHNVTAESEPPPPQPPPPEPQPLPAPPPNIKPLEKCAGCDNYIKTGQALLALDKHWHLHCFTCAKCGALLTGGYMGREGVPYCERDYHMTFGIKCAGCGVHITGKVLQAGEKHYHPNCSRCVKCGEMFGEGEDMYLQGNNIWHPHCSEESLLDETEFEISRSEWNDSETTFFYQSSINDSKAQFANEQEPVTFTKVSTSSLLVDFTKASSSSLVVDAIPEEKPVSLNLNPVPYGKPAGFRSVKPPDFRSVKPPVSVTQPNGTVPSKVQSSSDDDDTDAPPVPPPPTRSTSTQWLHKYAASGRNSSIPKSNGHISNENLGCDPDRTTLLNGNAEQELNNHYLSSSTTSLNSNHSDSSGTFPVKKGIGYNQLQHRINSQKEKCV